MPLVSATLGSAIKSVFEGYPSPSGCADGLANAYYSYASAGMFGASTPTIPPANKSAMASTLQSAISDPSNGSASSFASAWASAVTTFWIGVPVTGAQTGATVGCPGAASLSGSLTSIFGNTSNTFQSVADDLANALHTATLTTTAAVVPPPGTVLPIL